MFFRNEQVLNEKGAFEFSTSFLEYHIFQMKRVIESELLNLRTDLFRYFEPARNFLRFGKPLTVKWNQK